MEFYWYIVIVIILFISGFVDSVAGGEGLISLPAYLIAGVPPTRGDRHELLISFSIGFSLGLYDAFSGRERTRS